MASTSNSRWALRMERRTFSSADLAAGVCAVAWAIVAAVAPLGGVLADLIDPRAAAAFAVLALGRWYNSKRNGSCVHELGSIFMLLAIAPAGVVGAVLAASAAAGVVWYAVKKPSRPSTTPKPPLEIEPGEDVRAQTKIGTIDALPIVSPIAASKKIGTIDAKKMLDPIDAYEIKPSRLPGGYGSQEAFKKSHRPIYAEFRGCKKLEWGFCIDRVTEDATKAGGAGWIGKLVTYINYFTGIQFLTGSMCFVARWYLWSWKIEGETYYAVSPPLPIRRDDIPPHPLTSLGGSSHRLWVADPGAFVIGQPTELVIYSTEKNYWAVVATRRAIRKALRSDGVDLSRLTAARCGGSTRNDVRFATRIKANNRYK